MTNDLVKQGYEIAAEDYDSKRDQFKSLKYLEAFSKLVKRKGTILDIGCGAGRPVDEFLINQGFEVNGIDISEKMIELARKNVPEAFYEIKDMSELKDGEYNVDGIVAFYSIFHIAREKHADLFKKFVSFLPNGGVILITMGSSDWEGTDDNFHGAKMFWSHFGAKKNRELAEKAGFKILLDEIDTSGNEKHQILIGKLK